MKIRKLILFPVLGAGLALVAGSAAGLNITSNPSLQVGEVTDVSCADSASVSAWLYDDGTGNVAGARVRILENNHVDGIEPCAGNTLYVTPLNGAGAILSQAGHVHMTASPPAGAGFNVPGGFEYLVIFGADSGTGGWVTGTDVSAAALEGARIGIDQGPHSAHAVNTPAPLWPN